MATELSAEVEKSALEKAQALIGQPLDRSRQYLNTEATKDNVRQFCWAVGDDNPLWLDTEYARASAIGFATAPGVFLHSIDSTVVFPGLPGWNAFHIGSEWQWFEYVRVGDTFTAEASYVSCREVQGRKAGTLILQVGEIVYRNQDAVVIARARATVARISPTNGAVNYKPRSHHYQSDEIDEIREQCLGEVIRGGEPRYWEDVAIGSEIGPMVKGPLNLTDMMSWYGGGNPHGRRAHRIAWREVENNRDFYTKSKETGSYEFLGSGHTDSKGAQEWGMPGAYDNGGQRTSWLGHLVTDWMGDSGFLKSLSSRIILPNVFGDTTFLTGKVEDKRIDEDGDPVVNISISGINQIGEVSTRGTAEVTLPTRNEGTSIKMNVAEQ